MDATQQHLFNLLVEIDDICKKYDIEYFVDYGTMLGAIRHEGFIPWDDDIDITMTEDNYYKWVEACKKELDPSKRIYRDCRLDRDFPGVFGRYVNVETMRLASTFEFWEPVCGQSIDVFYYLELPGDEKKKQKAIDQYFAYDEYSNDSYRHYRMKTEEQMKLYRRYCLLEKFFGREWVLKHLEKRIFHHHYDDCDTFIVTSARKKGPTSIISKSCYDSVYMADFEGRKFPIPGRYVEALNTYYGDSWYMFPEKKKHHSAMSGSGIACREYTEDYMRFFDKDQLMEERKEYKRLAVEEGYRATNVSVNLYKKIGSYLLFKIKEQIDEDGLVIEEYLDASNRKKLAVLDRLFDDYYKKQLDSGLRYWEVYLDIGDELLYAALFNLVYYRYNYSAADKILVLRQKQDKQLSEKLESIKNLVILIRKEKAEIVYGRYSDAAAYLKEGLSKYPDSRDLQLDKLSLDVLLAESEEAYELCKERAGKLLERYPDNDECVKALGDIAFKQKDFETANSYYDELVKKSSNGMILLDIKNKRMNYD